MRIPQHLLHACGRTVTAQTAIQGVLAGGAVAGLMTTLFITAGAYPMTLHPPATQWPWAALAAMGLFIWIDLVATVCWALAITIVAAPQWAILNALGVRCWSAAVPLGAVLAPAPFFLVGGAGPVSIACLAVTGAVAGLVVWLIAYQKPAEGVVRA
jgi:hypothetical protein